VANKLNTRWSRYRISFFLSDRFIRRVIYLTWTHKEAVRASYCAR